MVKIPYIKIPGVRVGSIGPASNIGTGGATPAPPTPITYLTQWKIVGNSEVHTLPYPDGVVLPTGYTRCKYLEFHGTEYLNTGIKTNNGIGMSLTFSTTVFYTAIIGARVTTSSNVFEFGMLAPGPMFTTGYGDYGQQIDAPVDARDGHLHTFTLSNTQCTLDNINVGINFSTFSTPNANAIYIGTWNNSGTPDSRFYEGKIYSVRLYDSNGNLFNGIPCLDDNDVPCLYDTVSGTSFYNNGTGTFGYEIEPQPTEIWSCGEYNATDGKYHILVQPLGGSIADIALTEPLRKVNDVADSIEFANGVATLTRRIKSYVLSNTPEWLRWSTSGGDKTNIRYITNNAPLVNGVLPPNTNVVGIALCAIYPTVSVNRVNGRTTGISIEASGRIGIYDADYAEEVTNDAFIEHIQGVEVYYQLDTPTTELVDVPQIEEAESYTCVISQGAKAVSWSSFETNRE